MKNTQNQNKVKELKEKIDLCFKNIDESLIKQKGWLEEQEKDLKTMQKLNEKLKRLI